jgi:hypothetical protein
MVDFVNARVTILGASPYSQSKKVTTPKLERENDDAHELRTWREKMTTAVVDGHETMVIPAFGLQLSIVGAAQYLKRKIAGQGNTGWAGKFRAGISVLHPGGVLGVEPASIDKPVALFCNSDGVRGGGKRVVRYFPQIGADWQASFTVMVLDPIITEDVFTETLEAAGLFVGVGQFRPEKGGTNGRFTVKSVQWEDNRRLVPPKVKVKLPQPPTRRRAVATA